MAALSGYFDESFRNRIYVIAGYIGRADMFDADFVPAWRSIIRNAPHALSEFKASDCRLGFGEFEGWRPEEKLSITKSLVSVIADTCPYDEIRGVACGLVFPDSMSEAVTKRQIEEFGFDYCLRIVFENALLGNWYADGDEELRLICDDKPGFVHLMTERFDHAKKLMRPEDRKRVSHPIPECSKRLEPLQAADLLAYETAKELHSRIYEPHIPVSKALRRLVENRWHVASCAEAHVIEESKLRIVGGILEPDFPIWQIYMSGEEWRSESQWHPSHPKHPPMTGQGWIGFPEDQANGPSS